MYLICLMQVVKDNPANLRKNYEFTPKVKKSKLTDKKVSNILFYSEIFSFNEALLLQF